MGMEHPVRRQRGRGWAGGGILALLALSGCLVGPDHEPPGGGGPIPAEFKEAGAWKVAEPGDQERAGPWWLRFENDRLNALMALVESGNPDLEAAYHRWEQFRSVARLGGGGLYPEVTLEGSGERSRRSGTLAADREVGGGATTTLYRLPLTLFYEVDLWGRTRRLLEAAEADAEAARAAYHGLMLTLQTDLAAQFFVLRALDAEIRLLDQAVALREENLGMLSRRFEAGDVDALDVARAETELAAAESERIDLRRQRRLLENAIAVLSGAPSSAFTMEAIPLEELPPRIPEVMPSELLERRPDIAESERLIAAANARIGVAKAGFFPAIRLTGMAGFESGAIDSLLDWPSRVWSLGPGVSLPVFTGGRNRAEWERAKQRHGEVTSDYRATVLRAIREVDDSVVELGMLEEQAAAQERVITAARRAVALSERRYEAGYVAYFEVVDARRTLLEGEQLATRIQGARFGATIRLIKAIGGDWEEVSGFE